MSKQDHLWDEKGMAELVGLQLPDPTVDPDLDPSPLSTPGHESPSSETLLDPEDLEKSAAVGSQRKRGVSLATNPFTKLGVVAAGTGLVIGVLAVFTNGVMNGGKSQPAARTQADNPDLQVKREESVTADDRGQLLTDLALGRQQANLEALAKENARPEPPKSMDTPEFSPAPHPAPRPLQPVVQRSTPAPIPRVTESPRVMPPVRPRPVLSEPEVNPVEQWMALSHIGSYGRGSVPKPPAENAATPPMPSIPASRPVQLVRADSPSAPPPVNQTEEAAILLEQPMRSLVLVTGTHATAVLETPLIRAADTETESPRFVVHLTEPLLTPEKEMGLPADTQLVVQVQSVKESGLVQLAVTSFIQAGQEYPLPEGSVQRAVKTEPR
jgi:hypothetical protein